MKYQIERLRYQLHEDPSSRVFCQLARLLRETGEVEEAVEVLHDGLERHPRFVAAWVEMGRTQRELGDTTAAESAFARASELDPKHPVAARMLGEIAVERGEWGEALRLLRLAKELVPDELEIDVRIAEAEARLAEGRSAMDTFKTQAMPIVGGAEVVSLSDVDPFTLTEGDEVPLWRSTDDVFGAEEPGAETESDAPGESTEEPIVAPPPEDSSPSDQLPAEEGLEPGEDITEPDDVTPSMGTVAPPPVSPIAVPSREVPPLPTLTLARLAVQQGDFQLAETTLRALIDRDPDNPAALELLDRMRSGGLEGRLGRAAAKVAALQAWLDTIRLASERRTQ